MASPDRRTDPVPGENNLGLYAMLGFTVLSGIGLLAAMIFDAETTTVWVLLGLLVTSAVGFLFAVRTRATYLARVRNGDIIEREAWTGGDVP